MKAANEDKYKAESAASAARDRNARPKVDDIKITP